MLANGLKCFTDTPLTVLGMLVFLVTFVGVVLWTFFRSQSGTYYGELAKLPFSMGPEHE